MPVTALRGQSLADEILRLSDQLEAQFKREFLAAVAKISSSKTLKKLLDDIESGEFVAGDSIDARLNQVSFDTTKLDELARKAMGGSARLSGKSVSNVQAVFNVTNPDVVAVARTMSIDLSTNLTKTARDNIRKVIQDAVEGNITRYEASKKIRQYVGILPTHADAVDRYLDTMLQDGVKLSVARQRADKYAKRLLNYRADTIARTEIANAVGKGQTQMWKQMRTEGYLSPDAVRSWVTALDERVCPVCGPMNGVVADIDGYWDTDKGSVEYPSAVHPNCRCTSVITTKKSSKSKVSKFNPYHDELGRFTSANRSSGYAVKRQAAWQGLPSKISRNVKIRSAEQAGIKVSSQAEKILEEGPKGRLSTNSRTGHAQIIPRSAAKRMFGSTNEEVAGYIKKNFGITVDHSNSHPATYHAMLGVAQALTEIKASLKPSQRKLLFGKNGSLRKMKMSVDDPSGIAWYDNYKNQISLSPQAFTDIAIEAVQYGGAPSRASGKWRDAIHYVSLTSQKRTARSIPDAVRALGYAVTVHEVGHAIQQALERSSSRRYSPAGVGSTQYSSLSRKVARVSQYAYSDKYESFAESFAAWHLLSGSKSSAVQARLASPDMASLAQYALARIAKAMMEKRITQMPAVLAWFTEYLGTYDPNISKANPYHDERGRFTSKNKAGAGKSKSKGSQNGKKTDIGDEVVETVSGVPWSSTKKIKQKMTIREYIEAYTYVNQDYGIVAQTASRMPHQSKKPLHRGMVLEEGEFRNFVSQLKVGKKISVSGSWTESLTVAREFANEEKSPTMAFMGEYSVLATVRSGAKGLHVAPYAAKEFKYQKEWMLPNRKMKIVSFRVSGKRVYVELEQQ